MKRILGVIWSFIYIYLVGGRSKYVDEVRLKKPNEEELSHILGRVWVVEEKTRLGNGAVNICFRDVYLWYKYFSITIPEDHRDLKKFQKLDRGDEVRFVMERGWQDYGFAPFGRLNLFARLAN